MSTPTRIDRAVALVDDVLFDLDGPRAPGAPLWPGMEEHALVGSRAGVRMLVPLANRSVAAASFARGTNDRPGRDVLARRLAGIGLRAGAAQPMLKDRYAIRTTRAEGSVEPTLHEHLCEILGVPALAIAVNYGPDKPNVKPVLKLMDLKGRTIAYAKVAWNTLTTALVEHEAAFLSAVPRDRLRRVVVPEVIHDGPWRSGRLLVVSALTGSQRWVSPRHPSADAYAEVAELAPVHTGALGESDYRRRLGEAVADLGGRSGETTAAALAAIDGLWSGNLMRFGRWHGDWTPWNTSARKGRVILWDWERTAPDTPIGFDPLHYHFQPRFVRCRRR